jgi:hypothetical protein
MSVEQVAQPTEKIRLLKYHLVVLAFYVLLLSANYIAILKFARYIPEEFRALLKLVLFGLSAFQFGFLMCVIPLGVVFIFSFLYLTNIKADVRRLYQIVVISTIPWLLMMLGASAQTVLLRGFDAATEARLTELSQAVSQDIKQKKTDSPHATELMELLKTQQEKFAGPMFEVKLPFGGKVVQVRRQQVFVYVAVGLSCLLCGYLLHRRLNIKTMLAFVIPIAFAGSIFLMRTLTTTDSGSLTDHIKELMKQ